MEKTMKWWSECTANWRQKWSYVRDERNKYRQEMQRMKTVIESLQTRSFEQELQQKNITSTNKALKQKLEEVLKKLNNNDNSSKDSEADIRGNAAPSQRSCRSLASEDVCNCRKHVHSSSVPNSEADKLKIQLQNAARQLSRETE
ncbi:unnamed protein product [Soboliphyme baturini]|uniref:Coiled-coil domain-containing protein 102A n=1 Tax=Soboliphyme baturini TaxID=241478 RepID=A0A183J6J4_9BILA|nr:unnamed protein product [Soboliphyme baturini]